MRSLVLVALLASLSTTASAVPEEVTHQGRMFDALGTPLQGSHSVAFSLYDTAAGGSAVWSETRGLTFDDGYFHAELGLTNPLESDTFDGGDYWLGISVDSGPEGDRIPITSVPYAIYSERAEEADSADVAVSVSGGTVDATSVSVGGNIVINSAGEISWNNLVDVPAGTDSDTLADLISSCNDGEVAIHNAGAWACGTLDVDASQITTGVLDINRIPVGDGTGTVAAGDHTHVAADTTGGVFDVNLLPVGDGTNQVAAGDHTHPATDFPADNIASLACSGDGEMPAWNAGTSSWDCVVPSAGSGPDYPDSPQLLFDWTGDLCRGSSSIFGGGYEFPFNFNSKPAVITTIDETWNNSGAVWATFRDVGVNRFMIECNDRTEGLNIMAIEPGVHTIDGKMVQAGHIASGVTGSSVFFSSLFPSGVTPVIFLRASRPAEYTRVINNPGTGGFEYYVNDNGTEIHWVAFEPGLYNYGPYTFEVGTRNNPDNGDSFTWDRTFTTVPTVMMTIHDTNNNGATRVRTREVSETGWRIYINADNSEILNYLAVDIDK